MLDTAEAPASLDGRVAGQPVQLRYGVAELMPLSGSATVSSTGASSSEVHVYGLSLFLSDHPVDCGSAKLAHDSSILSVVVVGTDQPVITPGEARVLSAPPVPAGDARARLYRLDAQCTSGGEISAQEGRVSIATATDDTVAGDLDLVFPGGERVNGAFELKRCDYGDGPMTTPVVEGCF